MRAFTGLLFTLLWAVSFSLTALFLVARMLWVGLGVTPDDLRATLRGPGLVLRALLANVVVVPALALALVALLPLTAEARLAILLLATVPGGIDFLAWRPAPPAGERSAAALVFLLSIVAIVVSPAIRVLLERVGPPLALSSGRLLAVAVLGLLGPLLVGVAIRATSPAAAAVLTRVMAVLSAALFVAANLAVVVLGGVQPRGVGAVDVAAMAVFVLAAAAVGWLVGGPTAAERRLLARVTAIRNVGLALLLATVGVPHGGVDLAIVVFVVVTIVLRVMVAALATARRGRPSVDHAVPSA
jgi:bile acid:Na+ symporter, BASS family